MSKKVLIIYPYNNHINLVNIFTKKLYDKGIAISINTDNRTVSNTNLTKEYQNIVNSLGFTEDDIIKMNKDAIKHSFLLETEKQELLNKYNSLI